MRKVWEELLAVIREPGPTALRWWIWLRALGRVIYLARVSVIFGAIGVALLFDAQGRDSLVILTDDSTALHAKILFVVGLLLWGGNIWFWGRVATNLDADIQGTLKDRCERDAHSIMRLWVPRIASLLALGGANIALAKSIVDAEVSFPGWLLLPAAALLSVGLFLFLVYRRVIKAGGLLSRARRQLTTAQAQPASLNTWKDLSPALKAGALTIFLIAFVTLVVISFANDVLVALGAARIPFGALGSIFLFMLAASIWIAVPGYLSLWLYATRIPVIALGIALGLVFSCCNDNHDVRTSSQAAREPRPTRAETEEWLNRRATIESAWDEWLARQAPWPHRPDTLPVVIVTTAGGGLRTAVWTTEVLGRLHAADDAQFERRLFAISAVSGGALGATVYVALTNTNCLDKQISTPRACAQRLFQRDLLGPLSATFFYKDSVQHFWPWPLPGDDRAASLERSFETAFRDATSFDVLARPFHRLWSPGRDWPILVLNGTSVGAGRRILASNVQIDRRAFGYAVDLFHISGEDIPASTAVNMAGRFPFVEPAGTLHFNCARLPDKPDVASLVRANLPADYAALAARCSREAVRGRVLFDHIVDGGYFENFGATTADYLLDHLRKLPTVTAQQTGRPPRLFPIVIQISSDPDIELREGPDSPPAPLPKPLRWVQDFWSPISAIFATRGARGEDSTYSLAQTTFGGDLQQGAYFHLAMCKNVTPVPPLGWVMSTNVHRAIHNKVMTLDCQCNLGKFDLIVRCLKGEVTPESCAKEAYDYTRAGGKCPPQ